MAAIHDNVCVDESLPKLGFHTVIRGDWCNPDGTKVVVEQSTRDLLDRVSPQLRTRLQDLLPPGEIPRDRLVYLPREEFLALHPEKSCNKASP